MREVELKAAIADPEAIERRLVAAGATMEIGGIMRDRRYDTPDRNLRERDEVLRLRTYGVSHAAKASLDWKGPADIESGYKVREEISTSVTDPDHVAAILERLGYVVIREIDRRIAQYRLAEATLRVETYPRMDSLLEVEGSPAAIEAAIEALRMSRGEFSSEPLAAFVARFEKRTGVRAAISDKELSGDYSLSGSDK